MTISANRNTVKAKKFDLTNLTVHFREDKYTNIFVSAVYYQGRRLKRYREASRSIYQVDDFIIKIEPEFAIYGKLSQTVNEIKFYNRIKRNDHKYFPALIAFDKKRGVVVQEYIEFDRRKRSMRNRLIVEKIINRYNIDADINSNLDYNWGINKKTKLPCIFDLGYA